MLDFLDKEFLDVILGSFIGTTLPLMFVLINDYIKNKKIKSELSLNNKYCHDIFRKIQFEIDKINKEIEDKSELDEFLAGEIKVLYSNIKNSNLFFLKCTDFNLQEKFYNIYFKTPDLIYPIGDYINRNNGTVTNVMKKYFLTNFKNINQQI